MSETNRIEYKRELTPELDIEKELFDLLQYESNRAKLRTTLIKHYL